MKYKQRLKQITDQFVSQGGQRSVAVCLIPKSRQLGIAVLAEANAQQQMPAASVIKIVIAHAWMSDPEVQADLHTPWIAAREILQTEHPNILSAFSPDTKLSKFEVASLAMAVSDNDSANLMLAQLGHERIAALLSEIGATQTSIEIDFADHNFTMLRSSNLTTAYDLALILAYLQQRNSPVLKMMENNLFTNRIPRLLDESVIVAHKTGSLEGVCNDAAILTLQDKTLILAFLCSGQSDRAKCEAQISETALAIVEA